MHVPRGRFVECRCDDLALDGALHLGDLFGALVDQQHHHVDVGVVGRNRVRDVLHHHGLAAFRRCNQQGALAFSDGRNDVNHAPGDVFLGLAVALQPHLFLGEQGRQIFKHHLVLVAFGRAAVDFVEFVQRKVALAVFGRADLAFNHVPGMQVEAAHLAGADVDVVGTGGVAGIGAAQKTEAVGKDLQHTIGNDLFSGAGALFDDGEHQLLLAHAAGVFNFQRFGLE